MPHLPQCCSPRADLSRSHWLCCISADDPKPVPPDHAAKMAKSADLFKSHVGPLLKANCLRCHGGKKTEGGLDISNRDETPERRRTRRGESSPVRRRRACSTCSLRTRRNRTCPRAARNSRLRTWQELADWIDLGAAYDCAARRPGSENCLTASRGSLVVPAGHAARFQQFATRNPRLGMRSIASFSAKLDEKGSVSREAGRNVARSSAASRST